MKMENTNKENRTANSTYPKGGVSWFVERFVVAESLVLRMKFSAKNPALRVAAKRYLQAKKRSYKKKMTLIKNSIRNYTGDCPKCGAYFLDDEDVYQIFDGPKLTNL